MQTQESNITFGPGLRYTNYDPNAGTRGTKTIDGKCSRIERTLFDTELPLLPPTAHHAHKAAYYAPLVQMPAYE